MYILIILAFIFAGLESLAVWKGWRKLEFVAKPAVMVCLFIWLSATAGLEGALFWFGTGILFSLAGDIALLFIDRFFTLGLVAFLLAHIAYLVGFNIPFPESLDVWAFGIAIVIGLGAVRLLRRIVDGVRSKQPRLAVPVIVYSTAITLMLLSALLTLFRLDWDATTALLVSFGAALFYFSDIVLAWNRFVAPIKNSRMLNIGIYHLAQIAIVVGVAMQFGA
ncbi:MAG: lysoplasmalogenase [Anaerolineales bacterium]|nr:lysoplasmalogenase [Anaerolineales bacterium]